MRYIKSMLVLTAILATISAPVKVTVAQESARLEMKPEPVMLDSRAKALPVEIVNEWGGLAIKRPPCCPDPICCYLPKALGDFGIFISPQGSPVTVEKAGLEIYSYKHELLFRTNANCNTCGSGVILKPGDKRTGYLLTLNQSAVKAAQELFAEGNIIRIHLRIKGGGMPPMVYAVNVRAVAR